MILRLPKGKNRAAEKTDSGKGVPEEAWKRFIVEVGSPAEGAGAKPCRRQD